MPRVKPGERKRAKRPKTRTGCRTCKTRRVKCDETKPSCFRCSSTGRKCEGYEYSERAVSTINAATLSTTLGTSEERRAFSFFYERTAREISGFYESEFWNSIVLQAAHADPSIRHALAALSSLHETFELTGEVDVPPGSFALKQYNLAITKHLDALTRPNKDVQSVDTYLASCMIFICIELLQGHFVSASQLIQGAIQLLYESHPVPDSKSKWPLGAFEALLCRLQVQSMALFPASARSKVYAPRFMSVAHLKMPTVFESITQARDFLDFYTWHFLFPNSSTDPPDGHETYERSPDSFVGILKHWAVAFHSMLVNLGSNLSRKDQGAVIVLRMRHIMATLTIDAEYRKAYNGGDQVPWDSQLGVFRQLISMAEDVTSLYGSHDKPWKVNSFTLDYGLVSPMYDVARMCRDPVIRRKAIDILCTNPCREALWDGVVAARIAEKVMLMEENSVPKVDRASDVPASVRVAQVNPTFVSDSEGPLVSFSSHQSESNPSATVEEMVGLKPVDEFGQTLLPRRSLSSSPPTS